MKTLEQRLATIVALLPEGAQSQFTAPLTAEESTDTRLVDAVRALAKSEGLVCMTPGEFSRAAVQHAAQRSAPATKPADNPADENSPKALVARFMREAGTRNKEAAGDLLAPAIDKTTTRMHDAFDEIGKALSAGFDKGNSMIDTGDWQQHLEEVIGGVMQRVQTVSEQSRADAKPKVPNVGAYDEELDAKKKPSVSALQRIGGGGNASYSTGDPILREQQRQTRELSTQTGLLRDVKRAIENKPTASTAVPAPVFG